MIINIIFCPIAFLGVFTGLCLAYMTRLSRCHFFNLKQFIRCLNLPDIIGWRLFLQNLVITLIDALIKDSVFRAPAKHFGGIPWYFTGFAKFFQTFCDCLSLLSLVVTTLTAIHRILLILFYEKYKYFFYLFFWKFDSLACSIYTQISSWWVCFFGYYFRI